MFSVRFHFGRGKNYKHWQIKDLADKNCAPEYFDPLFNQLLLINCTLINNESKARKVYEAGVKDVCGWIRCEDFFVTNLNKYDPVPIDDYPRLLYNPIVAPYWMKEGREGRSIDNSHYNKLITLGNQVYIYNHCYSMN